MKTTEILQQYFELLMTTFGFELEEIKDNRHTLSAKFSSDSVCVYFVYEYREGFPQILFSKLNGDIITVRPGLYTIKELYQQENYSLNSFFLDEIMRYKNGPEYRSCFQDAKNITEIISICAELTKTFAKDFLSGDKENYDKINTWFKSQLISKK